MTTTQFSQVAAGVWYRAAERALAADLTSGLVRRGNTVLVPSETHCDRTYQVQLIGVRAGHCDCPAGQVGRPCKHRAAVAIRLYEREIGHGARVTRVTEAGAAALAVRCTA